MLIEDVRKSCVEMGLKLLEENLVSISMGNVSARDPDTGLFAIKPSSIEYPDITPKDVVVMDLEGTIVDGDLRPSSEWPMHLLVYQERPDIHGIVHTHSPFATSFAVLGKSIPPLNGESASLGGSVECARYEAGGTRELGLAALEKLGERDAVLLRNHGVLTVGPNLERAFYAAVIVENAAQLYIVASIIGTPEPMPDEAVGAIRDEYRHAYFQR